MEIKIRQVAVVIASCVLGAGATLFTQLEKRWFVDETFLYEQGSALSQQYLLEHEAGFAKKVEELLPWVVRIEVEHSLDANGNPSTNHGTGIILSGGQVVTAGHVMTANVNGGISKIVLTLPDGRVAHAELERLGETDWALLGILAEDGQEALWNSPVKLGEAQEGELAVFWGYPARLGLGEHGRLQTFHRADLEPGLPVSKLSPLLVVGSVLDAEALTLEPLAGFPAVGGMSGGPVLNADGEVIAVQVSVAKTTDNATGAVLYYRFNCVTLGAVPR